MEGEGELRGGGSHAAPPCPGCLSARRPCWAWGCLPPAPGLAEAAGRGGSEPGGAAAAAQPAVGRAVGPQSQNWRWQMGVYGREPIAIGRGVSRCGRRVRPSAPGAPQLRGAKLGGREGWAGSRLRASSL